MGQMHSHHTVEPKVRWGPPPQSQPQPLHWAAAGTGVAVFRGRGSSSSSGNSSGGSSGAGGSSHEATTVSNSSGIAVGGNISAAGLTIKRQRSTSGGGIYGSVGQRTIQQTSQEISEAEAKLGALQERCRKLEEENALMAAKEAVYLPYTEGQWPGPCIATPGCPQCSPPTLNRCTSFPYSFTSPSQTYCNVLNDQMS